MLMNVRICFDFVMPQAAIKIVCNPLNAGDTSVCLLTKFCRPATVCGVIIYTKFQNN